MSMNCKPFEQDLLLLAHGQLEAHAQKRVRQHLHDCPQCGERLAQLSAVSLLLADAIQTASPVPPLTRSPRPSFLPARESWLVSVLLAAFVTVALLGAWKSAQSFAPPAPPPSSVSSGPDSCLVSPAPSPSAKSGAAAACPLRRHVSAAAAAAASPPPTRKR